MKTRLKIGKLLDIPIKIHFTFIFILALFAWVFAIETISISIFPIGFGNLSIPLELKLLAGSIAAILLFFCVLLHELGHSYVTQRFGLKINSITLFIFGGLSESEEIPRDPHKEFKIAIAGPLVSIGLGVLFYLLFIIATELTGSLFFESLWVLFGMLSFYNLLLAGFNLIPAFPIDGGRILRAVLATKLEYQRATKTASNIGKGIAVAMIIFGIFFNLWLVVIAIFIYFGASQEAKTSEISEALKGKKVREIMKKDIQSVQTHSTLKSTFDLMNQYKQFYFPVKNNQEKIVGKISLSDLKKVDQEKWQKIQVKEVMNQDISTVTSDEDAFTVFKKLTKNNIKRLFVKNNNNIIGMITQDDFLKAIRFYRFDKGSD